jgi:hypothetical protein
MLPGRGTPQVVLAQHYAVLAPGVAEEVCTPLQHDLMTGNGLKFSGRCRHVALLVGCGPRAVGDGRFTVTGDWAVAAVSAAAGKSAAWQRANWSSGGLL